MTQTFDLNKMGLTPMSNFEMQEIDGGGFWDGVTGFIGVVVGQVAIVAGVMTFQPELIYGGALLTGYSLDYINKNS